jgi:hypothetical protein
VATCCASDEALGTIGSTQKKAAKPSKTQEIEEGESEAMTFHWVMEGKEGS